MDTNLKNNSFVVKLNVWEGPLDLLLDLIQSAKINIYDIQITTITNQYIEAIKYLKKLEISLAMDFIVMASTLIFLKSRAMLPVDMEDNDEDSIYFYSKEKLIEQLIEYQKYKQAAGQFEDISYDSDRIIARKDKQIDLPLMVSSTDKKESSENDNWQDVTLLDLIKVFSNVVDSLDIQDIQSLRKVEYKIEDKLAFIEKKISTDKKIVFWDLFMNSSHKLEIIVTFLAILELYKSGDLTIKQHSVFGEIVVFGKDYSEG